MRPDATAAMLRMQRLMEGLALEDQQVVAFEIYRTYGGGKHVSSTARTRGDTRGNTNGNTPENTRVEPVFALVSSPAPPDSCSSSSSSRQEKKRLLNANAVEILEFLNEKTGRSYRPVEENLRFIRARLDTCSVEDMKGVVARKTRVWKGTDMDKYLRPKTLFSATNFEQYLGEQPRA